MKAGTGLATSQQGAWQGGGRQHQPSGISLKEGRLFSPFNPLAGWLSSSCWGLRHRPLSPQLQNSLGGSSGLCTFPGFRLPPPSAPPPLLSPVPAQPPAAGECLTLLDLISNPLTFSSARQAWVQGNVTTPLPPAPRRPLQPQQPTRPLPDCTGGRQGPAADPGLLAPPTQTPSAGTAPPAPSLAFFTWLCKREGAQRCRQCCPVRPPARGPWYGPRPRGGQRGEGPALEGAAGSAGRACGSRHCAPSLPTLLTPALRAGKAEPRGSVHTQTCFLGRPARPPKLAGPGSVVQKPVPNSDSSTTDGERLCDGDEQSTQPEPRVETLRGRRELHFYAFNRLILKAAPSRWASLHG
ncbi:translation initiation factor IF-2-like [Orcinus orca]|uniref:translation initiation factor IF-2-like n=1 Tax=Orcinus orca TaxID=9733 RepID=UPI002112C0DF|nr:translation initiation factor IF-2-like [Orcinus orca]